ncbi:MAG: hypothetical protein JW903_09070 [Clostridia bacterium]|nr:hypothetical protein [Clostridia bacterium]
MASKDIIHRIFPMPREIKIKSGIEYTTNRIALDVPIGNDPIYKTIVDIMGEFTAPAQLAPDFYIRFIIAENYNSKKKINALKKKKNNLQAYAIVSNITRGVFGSIDVLALTATGLLYGALTLKQALSMKEDIVQIPVIDAMDWPEVAFRGQWGGNSNCDIPWTYQFKLNALDGKVLVTADEDGNPMVTHNNRLYNEATAHGIDIRATISHLEQISRSGFLEKRSDVLNVPSEERKKRSDYFPGLCMSKKATEDMIFEWFRGIAQNDMVKKILVWLSEESTPCYCEDCKGDEPFQLETACLLRAYERLKPEFPYIELGIMLSQGSFEVTDKIAAMLPREVSLTYYDGGRTYDSGKYPMIMPCLEKFVKDGGRLGVYPQITHSWRTVFPWTAPGFIRYRCNEFVSKGLETVIGYAVPSNRYHEFNLMAMAEWLWNPKGRSTEDFVRDYADLNNIPRDQFLEFIKTIETPAWKLAESKLMLRLTYNYSLILRGRVTLEDHRFEMSELIPIKNIEKHISSAGKALGIAKEIGTKELILEARCVLAGLKAYLHVTSFINEISKSSIDTEKVIVCYSGLRKAAYSMRKSIDKWSSLILPPGQTPHNRVVDTEMVLFRALDGIKRYMVETGISTSTDSCSVTALGEWDESIFNGSKAIVRFDITEYLKKYGPGNYYASLDFIEGESGTDFDTITIRESGPAGGEKCVSRVTAELRRMSVWAPWNEYPIKVVSVNDNCRYYLRMDLSAMEKGEKTCRGLIGIRKV